MNIGSDTKAYIDNLTPEDREEYEKGNPSFSIPPNLPPTISFAPQRLRTAKLFDFDDADSMVESAMDELLTNSVHLYSADDIINAVRKELHEALEFSAARALHTAE